MRFTRAAVSAALLFSCVRSAPSSGSAYGAWGVDLTTRIRGVRPGDDFFGHANGGWLNTFEIPDDATSYGIVDSIRHRVERRLLAALQEPTGEWGPTEAKLRDAFAAAVDTEQRDRLGLEPIEVSLNAIASATSWDGLNPALAELHPSGPFEIGIIADPIDPGRYIAFVVQSGPRGGTGPRRERATYLLWNRDWPMSIGAPRIRSTSKRSTTRCREASSPPKRRSITGTPPCGRAGSQMSTPFSLCNLRRSPRGYTYWPSLR